MRIVILSRNGELYSTKSIYNAARRKNHFVRIIDHMQCDLVVVNGACQIIYEGQSLHGYDAVIPRIGHTVTKYGSAVIRQFEVMKVFTTVRSQALIKARDKLSCLQLLSSHGIGIPGTVVTNNPYVVSELASFIGSYPKIMKLLSGTHGLGVLKADDVESLESLSEVFNSLKQRFLLQEFVAESSGQDIRIFIVDGKVVASMLRQAQDGEFRSNLHRGGSSHIVTLSKEEERIALKSVNVMGLKVAGVDMLRSERGPLVLEVNASPGLEGIETTTRIDIAKEIIEFIERKVKHFQS